MVGRTAHGARLAADPRERREPVLALVSGSGASAPAAGSSPLRVPRLPRRQGIPTPKPLPQRDEDNVTLRETFRLVRFFVLLAVKEHAMPDLHVRPLVAELFLTDNCNLRCVSSECWR